MGIAYDNEVNALLYAVQAHGTNSRRESAHLELMTHLIGSRIRTSRGTKSIVGYENGSRASAGIDPAPGYSATLQGTGGERNQPLETSPHAFKAPE
jgi:hypothetical protein